MNEYYQYLVESLFRYGYGPVRYQDNLYLTKQQQEDTILLLRLIEEPLPGQNPVDLGQEWRNLKNLEHKIMISQGKMVESLIVEILDGNPGEKLLQEIESYDNVWFLNRDLSRIHIYENQKASFHGLDRQLEDAMGQWSSLKATQRKDLVKKTFTPVNTSLILINILVFAVLSMMGNTEDAGFIANHGGMVYDFIITDHEYYRMFTSMFVHFGLQHLLENMMALLLLGQILERNVGKVRYFLIYMGAGLVSSVSSLFFTLQVERNVVSGGASGCVCGVLGGLCFLILYQFIFLKKKSIEGISPRGILFIIFISVGYGFTVGGVDNAAHLGGLVGGFVLTAISEMVIRFIKHEK